MLVRCQGRLCEITRDASEASTIAALQRSKYDAVYRHTASALA
jgi:hypothetical protein